jgi:hypothetical protein
MSVEGAWGEGKEGRRMGRREEWREGGRKGGKEGGRDVFLNANNDGGASML